MTNNCADSNFWKDTSGTADVCSAVTAACGNQAPVEAANAVQRTQSSAATGTSDLVCQACTAGTFAAGPGDNCVACTGITGADTTLNAVTYTCTSATDTRFASGGCAGTSTTKKTVGATGVATTCTTTCAEGSWDNANSCTACTPITGADVTADAVTYTCTSATDTRFATGGCAASSTTKKTVGATGVMTTCTATCDIGSWDNANSCTACTAITGADATPDAVTYTCTSATDTRFATGGCAASSTTKKTVGATGVMTTCTSCCGANTWDNSNTCVAHVVCGNQLNGATRETTAGTANAQTQCAQCTTGTFSVNEKDNCVTHSVCGNQLCVVASCDVAVQRTTISAGNHNTDTQCQSCASGTFAIAGGNDCAAYTTCGTQIDGATTRLTDESADNAGTCSECNVGTFATAGTTDCEACTAIVGAASGVTCTNSSNSRTATCSSCTPKKTPGGSNSTDLCTVACAAGTWDSDDVCSTCPPMNDAISISCTSASDSVAITCATGFNLKDGKCIAMIPCENCPLPASVSSHGSHGCTQLDSSGQLIDGTTCATMKCSAGYEQKGSLTCTCGKMTITDLKCIPIPLPSDKCGLFPIISNGGKGNCVEGTIAGNTCTPGCASGYEADGIGLCQSDGTWAKFKCALPELESGVIFVRISKYASTDCYGDATEVIEHKECRCRGNVCQKMTCEVNGDYTIASYETVGCEGWPKGTVKVLSDHNPIKSNLENVKFLIWLRKSRVSLKFFFFLFFYFFVCVLCFYNFFFIFFVVHVCLTLCCTGCFVLILVD